MRKIFCLLTFLAFSSCTKIPVKSVSCNMDGLSVTYSFQGDKCTITGSFQDGKLLPSRVTSEIECLDGISRVEVYNRKQIIEQNNRIRVLNAFQGNQVSYVPLNANDCITRTL